MTSNYDHEPTPFYWDADTEHCPHKPIPERYTDAWDEWMTLGHQTYDDGVLCLSAPAGTCCPACSAEHGDMVAWSFCDNRQHARAFQPAKPRQHQPVTVDVAGLECLERECEEYFTDDGDEIPGKEACSHVKQLVVCGGCSDEPTASNEFPAVVAWVDCAERKTEAVQR
ncbi:hypothetical protein [Streptomyces sp.]|uniref:hypothetical protein n=1 Tax=Streptomyces sp. TaxID=1931 RepID=UPI002811239B|nr:hypothetical protein [Streptomyces sp.]